jgi:ribose 5-phosphate isomerase B
VRIAIGSDHAGFNYKTMLAEFLAAEGHYVEDFGTHSTESVDYPIYIRPVAEAVARGEFEPFRARFFAGYAVSSAEIPLD